MTPLNLTEKKLPDYGMLFESKSHSPKHEKATKMNIKTDCCYHTVLSLRTIIGASVFEVYEWSKSVIIHSGGIRHHGACMGEGFED